MTSGESGGLIIRDPDCTVVLGPVRPTSISEVDDDEEGEFDVSLRTSGLTASATVLSGGVTELPAWLERLARSFRGWQGIKRWSTWDRAVALEASHDGAGHVTLFVAIAAPDGHDPDWTARVRLMVDAGEDMRNLAEKSVKVFDLQARPE